MTKVQTSNSKSSNTQAQSAGSAAGKAVNSRPQNLAPTASQVKTGEGLITKGQQGQPVQDVQQELQRRGYKVSVDGKFGPETQRAVRQFQSDMRAHNPNFMVDGKVGPQTLGALEGNSKSGSIENSSQRDARRNSKQAVGSDSFSPASTGNYENQSEGTVRASDLQQANPARRSGVASRSERGFRTDASFSNTPAGREQQAEQLLRQNGVNIEPGKTNALQIDQEAPANGSTRDYLRSYSGQTGVFRAGEDGRLQEVGGPFQSASHPSGVGNRNMQSVDPRVGYQDVDGDNRSDIAHLQPGVYEYSARARGGRYNMTDTNVAVHRDTNHDGRIDDREAQDWHNATGIQIHAGGSSRPSSAGCQTMPPSDYRNFQQAISESTGGQGSFTYVSVHRANESN